MVAPVNIPSICRLSCAARRSGCSELFLLHADFARSRVLPPDAVHDAHQRAPAASCKAARIRFPIVAASFRAVQMDSTACRRYASVSHSCFVLGRTCCGPTRRKRETRPVKSDANGPGKHRHADAVDWEVDGVEQSFHEVRPETWQRRAGHHAGHIAPAGSRAQHLPVSWRCRGRPWRSVR